jgi:hypothetical protein
LRRLRERLADVPRADVDAALRRLAVQPDVYLEREMNQKTLTAADRAAAIQSGRDAKHPPVDRRVSILRTGARQGRRRGRAGGGRRAP